MRVWRIFLLQLISLANMTTNAGEHLYLKDTLDLKFLSQWKI